MMCSGFSYAWSHTSHRAVGTLFFHTVDWFGIVRPWVSSHVNIWTLGGIEFFQKNADPSWFPGCEFWEACIYTVPLQSQASHRHHWNDSHQSWAAPYSCLEAYNIFSRSLHCAIANSSSTTRIQSSASSGSEAWVNTRGHPFINSACLSLMWTDGGHCTRVLVLNVPHHCLHQLHLHSHKLLHKDWSHGGTSATTPASASPSSGYHLFSKTNVGKPTKFSTNFV